MVTPVYAAQVIPRYQMENYNKNIEKIYKANIPTNDKIVLYSKFFLGKPYYRGALGEGPNAQFDKDPLYRTDKFDCVTFVSTVLALAESNNLTEFQKNIKKIRYKNGKVSYLNRNHFTSVDWNKNNIKNGYLKDITPRFAVAETNINKPMWYKMLKPNTIKYFTKLSSTQEKELINDLHALSKNTQVEKSTISYIPLSKLFINNKPNTYLFNQIPSGSVIEIIRPNWDLTKIIGTHLNVSHMGLAIRTEKGLMFREASSSKKWGRKIIDVPLITYLRNNNRSDMGINIQQIILEK